TPTAPTPTARSLSIVSGNNQTGSANTPLPQPLVVAVTGNGQPLANQAVTWQVTSGSATLAKPSPPPGSNGQTQNTLTLGATPGSVVVTASANGASVSFTTAPVSPTLSIVSGNNQTRVATPALPQS